MTATRGIFYFQYRENREAIRGAGFARIVVRGDSCNIECCLQGLKGGYEGTRSIYAVTEEGESQIGEIAIIGGRGQSRIVENVLDCSKLVGIRIPITEKRDVYCEIQESLKNQPNHLEAANNIDSHSAMEFAGRVEPAGEMELLKSKSEMRVPTIDKQSERPETLEQAERLERPETLEQTELPKQSESLEQTVLPKQSEQDDTLQKKTQQDSKWKQLCDIYGHMHPFRDKRDYLAIGPQDFVILTEKYYRLVQNSFLLHGYYQYQHLLLGRVDRRCGPTYYIGVPGSYFEKEKQAAMLYGFESFEAEEEPAKEGDFGYYFVKVEL